MAKNQSLPGEVSSELPVTNLTEAPKPVVEAPKQLEVPTPAEQPITLLTFARQEGLGPVYIRVLQHESKVTDKLTYSEWKTRWESILNKSQGVD